MDRFRVVIAGGGIAAVEGLLRLRSLMGDRLAVTVIAPEDELRYRPLAVTEPFGGRAQRYRLGPIVRDAGAELAKDAVEWIDPDAQVVHTTAGNVHPYDALLLAIGARSVPVLQHATTFDDAHADDTLRGLVQDIEEGYTKRVAMVIPDAVTWPLPLYELALQTADRAYSMGFDDAQITLVTHEEEPLAVFGEAASTAARDALFAAGVHVVTRSTVEVPANRQLVIQPSGERLEVERIVTLPGLEGRSIRGVPTVDGGFVPIDDRCRVVGLGDHVFAAGDATDYPIKQGTIGTQQADVAAAGIAALAGDAQPERLEPVVRAALIAGERARVYVGARIVDGVAVESRVLDEPDWPAGEKVVARELGPFLRSLDARR